MSLLLDVDILFVDQRSLGLSHYCLVSFKTTTTHWSSYLRPGSQQAFEYFPESSSYRRPSPTRTGWSCCLEQREDFLQLSQESQGSQTLRTGQDSLPKTAKKHTQTFVIEYAATWVACCHGDSCNQVMLPVYSLSLLWHVDDEIEG